jgi:hypothetical protein
MQWTELLPLFGRMSTFDPNIRPIVSYLLLLHEPASLMLYSLLLVLQIIKRTASAVFIIDTLILIPDHPLLCSLFYDLTASPPLQSSHLYVCRQ